jgi:hypothetical protein
MRKESFYYATALSCTAGVVLSLGLMPLAVAMLGCASVVCVDAICDALKEQA